MLLADHGADVVRIEAPGMGADRPGEVVWHRGTRRVALDADLAGRPSRAVLDLAARADVADRVVPPGRRRRRSASSTTPCGRSTRGSCTRRSPPTAATPPPPTGPDVEWLVTARTGLQADQRGWYGTRMDHIMGLDLTSPASTCPTGADQLGCREGPIFLAVPWASLGAALLATTATSAGLYVAERTGVGQHVETSLAQAVINMNAMGWQRVATDAPELPPVVLRPAGAEGHLPGRRRRWLHQWAPFEHAVPAGQRRRRRPGAGAAGGRSPAVTTRPASGPRPRRSSRPPRRWPPGRATSGCASAPRRRIGLQPILSPEEALLDEPLAAEGVIVELDDPEHGPIRQVGHVYAFDGVASPPIRPRPAAPTDVADVAAGVAARDRPVTGGTAPAAPLAGVARARLRPGHRRSVRPPDPRRPRRRR